MLTQCFMPILIILVVGPGFSRQTQPVPASNDSFPVGIYCETLIPKTCCSSRDEKCSVAIASTKSASPVICFCDTSCYQSDQPGSGDCCPDYVSYCGGRKRLEEKFVELSGDFHIALTAAAKAEFLYDINMTNETKKRFTKYEKNSNDEYGAFLKKARQFMSDTYNGPISTDVKYMLSVLKLEIEDEKNIDLSDYNNERTELVSEITYKCTVNDTVMARFTPASDDINDLVIYYDEMHNIDPSCRKAFLKLLKLKQATFSNPAKEMRSVFQMDDDELVNAAKDIYMEILPLFEALFTYARRMQSNHFNTTRNSTVYAAYGKVEHACLWMSFLNHIPYPKHNSDVDSLLEGKNYSVIQSVELGEQFFTSIGLKKLPNSFWSYTVLKTPEPPQRSDCMPAGYDFLNGDIATINCIEIGRYNFYATHYELGHMYSFMAFQKQPVFYRRMPRPFESIGDVIYLSTMPTSYLHKVGLLHSSKSESYEAKINRLFARAVHRLPVLIDSLALDEYRWQLLDGTIPIKHLNRGYWRTSYKLQGIVPTSKPNEEDQIHALTRWESRWDYSSLNGLLGLIVSHHIHDKMCEDELDVTECSVYGNKLAGEVFQNLTKYGKSKPWIQVVKDVLGIRKLTAKPILKYFKPLHDWLDKQNEEANECYGWGYEWPDSHQLKQPRCKPDHKLLKKLGISHGY